MRDGNFENEWTRQNHREIDNTLISSVCYLETVTYNEHYRGEIACAK